MKNSPTIAPLIINPITPARRPCFMITPMRLSRKPRGVAASTVNPPRVAMGDPQPGWASHIRKSAARAATEQHTPIRPSVTFELLAGSASITGGCSIFSFSELHRHRFAGRLQRLKVKLDVHRDLLAVQIAGYPP
jgi:hypothetical protein